MLIGGNTIVTQLKVLCNPSIRIDGDTMVTKLGLCNPFKQFSFQFERGGQCYHRLRAALHVPPSVLANQNL